MSKMHISAAVAAVIFAADVPASDDALAHVEMDLFSAGVEENYLMPGHGFQSVHDYIDWINDGEDARFEMN